MVELSLKLKNCFDKEFGLNESGLELVEEREFFILPILLVYIKLGLARVPFQVKKSLKLLKNL